MIKNAGERFLFFIRGFMKDRYEGSSPILRSAELALSGTLEAGLVNCRNLKSIVLSGRAKFHSSGTGNLTVNVYYSPDGNNFDTTAFSYLTLTCSAGNIVQASSIVTMPDTGFCKISISNADATYAATDIAVWVSVVYQFIEDRILKSST
jgi:hypothetical protein